MSEKKQRRKVNERQDPPLNLKKILERQSKAIKAVYRYRAMSEEQLHRLIFTGIHIINSQIKLSAFQPISSLPQEYEKLEFGLFYPKIAVFKAQRALFCSNSLFVAGHCELKNNGQHLARVN